MGRKKSFLKIPFLKKTKINSKTVGNMIGFGLITTGVIILLSFINIFSNDQSQGRVLIQIKDAIVGRFGILAIFVPFLVMLFALHFFNSKKLKFVKYNITLGLVLLLVAMLGLLRTGSWGKSISDNLELDFSSVGRLLILLAAFLVGIILFLDTSIDVFILFIIHAFKGLGLFFRNHVFRTMFDKKAKSKSEKTKQNEIKDETFIEDKKITDKSILNVLKGKQPGASQPVNMASASKDLIIKPLSQNLPNTSWIYPPLTLLQDVSQKEAERGDVASNADKIEKTLDSFGIRARVSEINKGPTVTQYALAITMGTKLSKITALANDLALALAAPSGQIRIEAPIPGRSLVGVEIPNVKSQLVPLKQMLTSQLFAQNTDPLYVPLGLDVSGNPMGASISKMPHVLIAGTTGSGKSVMLNTWITTILFRTKPDEVRMILVDPKRVELTSYNGIPHLLSEVVVDPDKIISALRWTVAEMENRYKIFAHVGARNIECYNAMPGVEKKPYLLFVIDELADLMMFAPGDAEDLITRIAQMARATGIHLILATQRPSVDVITGLMKANIPTRLAFNVSSLVDSRVIIDTPGAEKLMGKGDMLFLPPDQAKPRRIQAPFLSEKEVHEVVNFLKAQVPEVHYTEEITTESGAMPGMPMSMGGGNAEGQDALFKQSLAIIMQTDKASASLLQRKLSIGYNRAARILDQLEAAGYVGPAEGAKPREVIKRVAAESV